MIMGRSMIDSPILTLSGWDRVDCDVKILLIVSICDHMLPSFQMF